MPNEFVIQAPTNSLQLNEQRQAEFTYNVFNASGRPLRAQAIIRTTPAGGEGWFTFAPAERDFPISHSEQYKLQISVPPTAAPGSYTFALDMLWEGSEEPEQRTVAGQSVTFEVPKPQAKGTPWWVYALAGGGLLVIIAVVVIVILSNRTVAVPDLSTMTADQAKAALERAGLKLNEKVNQESSDTVPAGLVISYEPGQGEQVKPGTVITLVISNGAVLHRTTTTILSNSPNLPHAFGSTTVFFNVALDDSAIPPVPSPVGTVSVSVVGGTQTCTGSLDASGKGSCSLSNLSAGASNLQATYNPQSSSFATSTSADYALLVLKANAALVLQSQNPATSYIKGPASFTLAFSGSETVPTGTVMISAKNSAGSTAVCQNVAKLVNGQGACSITFNTAGSWDLYYTYSGDSSYNPITTPQSLNAKHSVSKYPTAVKITKISSNFITSTVVSYRVTKIPVNGITIPDAITGQVTINTIGNLSLKCTGSINKTGDGSCRLQFPFVSSANKAVASYSGDDNYDVSTSK